MIGFSVLVVLFSYQRSWKKWEASSEAGNVGIISIVAIGISWLLTVWLGATLGLLFLVLAVGIVYSISFQAGWGGRDEYAEKGL